MGQVPPGALPAGSAGPAVAGRSESPQGLAVPGAVPLSPGLFKELSLHLVRREIDATHRMTVLGWAWPLVRQLVQLGILVFIFGSVVDLGIDDFPVFVFSGLIAWNWFSTGCTAATGSLLDERHLLFQPRLPPAVLPIVAIIVPLVDVLMALPVLVLLLLLEGGVPVTALLIPLFVVVQLVLMSGIAWIVSAAAVFLRDVPNIVGVALNALFYLTPVFYGIHTIPEKYRSLLELNPMATIVNGYRAILLHQPVPGAFAILYTLGLAALLCVVGYLAFTRIQDRFVDNL
jgi:lipopolysaccharide transport system permease protein